MAEFLADQFSSIARRLKEIEQKLPQPQCSNCNGQRAVIEKKTGRIIDCPVCVPAAPAIRKR